MRNKLLIAVLALVLVLPLKLKADEGMWLPFLIEDALFQKMQEMGMNLSPEEVFSFTESSIKDAVVSFGGFCTGEIISDQGLVLTNHHCGYGRIQRHSSVENDLLTDGFWAMSKEEELPNPGLFVRFLVNVEDVTTPMEEVLSDDMTEEERTLAIRAKSNELIEEATAGNHYTANVRSMFAGNMFYLFIYETFNDVRLVGAPPSSIGAFGGDTDNWEWPRHTGDFALFRVYTAPDGSPAEYDEENIPLRPKHHLPVSIRGVEEDDFAMVLGFSGRTERYLTSHGIEYRLENMYPVRIDIRRKKLDILEENMAASDEIRIKYASKHSGISNYWKNFIGMSESLKRLNVADEKRALENRFDQWVQEDAQRMEEYGEVLEDFQKVYDGYREFDSHNYVFIEAMATGPDVMRLANGFQTLAGILEEETESPALDDEVDRLMAAAERTYRNYDQEVDKQLWEAMFEIYYQKVSQEHLPEIFDHIGDQFKNDFQKYAEKVYDASIFGNKERLTAFLENPVLEVLEEDPVFMATRSVYAHYQSINTRMEEYRNLLSRANRLFQRALLEMKPDHTLYPDANGTMRFTYGTVNGYYPMDAVYYDYKTTLSGVMEKEDPDHHEFVVPEKLKDLYFTNQFGRYGENGQMVVNFISNNDITGGNSGSPVINGDGHLIGVAFDANWEGMSGDILFEDEMQKCINVDARYMLFVIEKFSGASHLIDEMTIVE